MEVSGNIKEIYRDLFKVGLGPFARATTRRSLHTLVRAMVETMKYSGKTIRDLFLYGRKPVIDHPPDKDRGIWLMVGSRNNLESLRFILHARSDCQVLVFSKDNRRLGPFPRLNLAPQGFFWWKAVWLLPALWKSFGDMLLFHLDTFCKGLGCFECACAILREERPRALVFANDHSAPIRAFAWAARTRGIPTIYIQHASISTFFPPLIYDLSLLEGQVALDTYRRCGPLTGIVELVGMPKFDPYLPYRNEGKEIRRIGVCTNMLDKPEKVLELLEALCARFPDLAISYRPHPRDRRRIPIPKSISVSDAQREGVFPFLTKQDLIIAGDTSTHLEATLLNVTSLYYPMHDNVDDYYGFVANGVVDRMPELFSVVDYIFRNRHDRPQVFHRAKPYHALVGTPREGDSQDLALHILDRFLDKTIPRG